MYPTQKHVLQSSHSHLLVIHKKKMSTNYNYQFQKHCHDIFIDEILGVIKKDVSIVCV